MQRKNRTAVDKAILSVLAEHANQNDLTCWPGISTISREAGTSRSTTMRSLKRLQEDGFIEITRETRKSNIYDLLMPKPTSKKHGPGSVDKSKSEAIPVDETSVTLTLGEGQNEAQLVSPRHQPGVTVTPQPVSEQVKRKKEFNRVTSSEPLKKGLSNSEKEDSREYIPSLLKEKLDSEAEKKSELVRVKEIKTDFLRSIPKSEPMTVEQKEERRKLLMKQAEQLLGGSQYEALADRVLRSEAISQALDVLLPKLPEAANDEELAGLLLEQLEEEIKEGSETWWAMRLADQMTQRRMKPEGLKVLEKYGFAYDSGRNAKAIASCVQALGIQP